MPEHSRRPLTLVAGLLCLEKRVSYWRLLNEFDLEDEILNETLLHGSAVDAVIPCPRGLMRCGRSSGRPSSSIRFRTSTAIATSAA